MFFSNWFSKKEPEPEGCDHDWEVVERGDYYRYRYNHLFFPCDSTKGEWSEVVKNLVRSHIPILPGAFTEVQRATNRVCVKCGECDNQISLFKKMYRDKKLAVRRRKMWAKQLWEDGCKK